MTRLLAAAALLVMPKAGTAQADLEGIWQAEHSAYLDVEKFIDPPGGKIPYRADALLRRNENFKNRETSDSLKGCFLPGVPRITLLPMPFQMFQTGRDIAIVYQYAHAYRTIFMDGSRHPDDHSLWNGDSRGHWEGSTLVVDVANFNGETWLDAAGNYHSDALHVVERYTRVGSKTLRYEARIEDPKVFTRAWKIRVPLDLDTRQNARLPEGECDTAGQGREASPIPSRVGKRGPGKPGPVPRLPDGKPNLEGYWISQAADARYGIEEHSAGPNGSVSGPGIVIDPSNSKIPYQGWARAKQQALQLHAGSDEPEAHCSQPGVPQQMWTGFGFQILQPRAYVVLLWDRMHGNRIIAMDGRQHVAGNFQSTQGDSIGQWDGDTLVIDTTHLNDKTWLDSAGDFHSDKEHVVERFTPVDSDTIDYRATIEDPRVYYRKWTVGFPIWRDPSPPKEQGEPECGEGQGK